MLNILSLGAGVQSSTVLLMSCRGVLPKLDAAIFADTQWEPKAVYRWLDNVLEPAAQQAAIPIYRVTAGNLRTDALNSAVGNSDRWASMPFFTSDDGSPAGMLRRQCTTEYKIEPVHRKCRELLGKTGRVKLWMGISGDEQRRMRMSRVLWIEHYYPLVFGLGTEEGLFSPWHRRDCVKWLAENGYGEAPRSACIGCPYRDNLSWRQIKKSPDEWHDAVEFDAAIRTMANKTTHNLFLHRSCVPLDQVDLSTPEERGQQNWLNECEGMCGV